MTDDDMAGATDGPVFHVEPRGRLGSRLIQYMAALKLQSLVPGCRIANVVLPEWGIDHPPIESPGPVEFASEHQFVDIAGLAERIRAGKICRVAYTGFGRRMENFLAADACREAIHTPEVMPARFDERHLICPIRVAAVPDAEDPDHPLMPVEFYADIVEETGLTPVFIGQTTPDLYTNRLRARFPQALFLDRGDSILDFATIRQAKNIVVGVSIFTWLAAWLSHADRIFMAVTGMFNPMQCRSVDLLPFGDIRYRFYLFPINYAVLLEHHATAHRRIAPFWRQVPHEVLRRRLREAPRFDPSEEAILADFDPAFYLGFYGDVAKLVGADNAEGARAHYMRVGMRERRLPFRLAPAWYAARYPMAAFEVAQGDYSDFARHYIAVGRARGYRPLPDDGEPWWD
ncbi:MAG TPA: hypothetical protein VND19_01715 [Acetobacteraceae bacterium]|nr:hypothetical protein [Acetobacteraceae bacterium]